MMKKDVGMISRFFMLCSAMVFSITLVCGIASAGLTADFSVSDECGLLGLEFPDGDTLTLTDATTTIGGENVVSWSWNTNPVHRGYPSYDENPPVISPVIGPASFDVTLTVTGSQSSSSNVTKTVTIFNDPWISANFSHIVEYDKDPLMVRFIDQSETSGRNIIRWYWNISGDKYDEQMPNVTLSDGVHDVILVIVTDQGEYARVVKTIGVHSMGSDLPPIADFSADKTRVSVGERVNFTDQSKNFPTSWAWDFGDGQKSNLQSLSHAYNSPGKYQVTLTVANKNGQSETSKTIEVIVMNSVEILDVTTIPSLSYGIVQGDVPLLVKFSANASVNGKSSHDSDKYIAGWSWTFGDSDEFGNPLVGNGKNVEHMYTKPGIYDVSVKCKLFDGYETEYLDPIRIFVGPDIVPSYYWEYLTKEDTCCYLVKFTDTSLFNGLPLSVTYNWDFGDGAISNEVNPTHRFKEVGNYSVILDINTDSSNANITHIVPITSGYIAPDVIITPTPTPGVIFADFKEEIQPEKLKVQFFDTSQGLGIHKWDWKFGDGIGSSDVKNPEYTYAMRGQYLVTLEVSNGLYSDKVNRWITVDN